MVFKREDPLQVFVDEVEVAIIGGGTCGVICAARCAKLGISYKIIDRQITVGGVWLNYANNHSSLQCPEIMYRWDPSYPLGNGPLDRITGSRILERLRDYARDHQMFDHARFRTEVETVKENEDGYTLILKGLEFGTTRHLKCKYLMVTHGILAHQYTPAERGLDTSRFRGPVSLAGKDNGVDCVAGTQDLTGKEVVVLGSGAFACEAMEAAIANNAKHVTMVCRDRKRWVLPFSREMTLGALAQAPLLPWSWKMDITHWWLKRYFYGPAGIVHMMPGGGQKAAPRDNDYAGQSNDAMFQQAKAGRVTCKVDSVATVEEEHIVLGSGERVRADVIVSAYGLKYQANPEFLKELGIGFKDLHNFAFLGASGRIGTAQDGIYAYVPAGPHKQFDMFLHSYACYKKGMLQTFQEHAMEHTPIPQTSYESLGAGNHRSAWGTWFEVAKPWSVMNSTFEWRARVYYRAMSFGRSPLGKLQLRVQIAMADLFQFICLIFLGVLEYFHDPNPLKIKRKAKKSDAVKKAA